MNEFFDCLPGWVRHWGSLIFWPDPHIPDLSG
jgi:hypothetical protein